MKKNSVFAPVCALVVVGILLLAGLVSAQHQSPLVEDVVAIITAAAEGKDIGSLLAQLDNTYVDRASLGIALKATVKAMHIEAPESPNDTKDMIPDDWREIKNEVVGFSIAFPQDWVVARNDADGIALHAGANGFIVLSVHNSGIASIIESLIGNQDEIELFYKLTTSEAFAGSSLGETGTWSNTVDGIYCDILEEDATKTRMVSVPIDSENAILAGFNPEVADERILGRVLASIRPLDGSEFAVDKETTMLGEDAVQVLEWTWFESSTGKYIKIQGTVKNISDEPVEFVKITAILRDANGKFLSTDSGYAEMDVLLPGQTSTWEIMTENMPGLKTVELSGVQWKVVR